MEKQLISGAWDENMRGEGSCSRRNVQSVHGVPTQCWCGSGLTTYISKTEKNPFRKFYRCKIALQRIGENHLFKWVDEAWNEEILMVEARQSTLEEEFEGLKMDVTGNPEEDEALKGEASKDDGCLGVITLLCSKFW